MNSITLPKSKFEILRRRASLYEALLKFIPERKWGIEEYTSERVREFMREDRLDSKTRSRIKRVLSSRT